MEEEIKNQIAAIVATAPDQIGAVVLWPDRLGETKMLGGLLDHNMQLIPGSTLWNASDNLFIVLATLERTAQLIRNTHMAEEQSNTIAREMRESQVFFGHCANEKS
jgi:hypothetical protein